MNCIFLIYKIILFQSLNKNDPEAYQLNTIYGRL